MIKALIFDFDGLILDTETPEYLAINEIYLEHGLSLPITTYGQVVGSYYNQDFEPVSDLSRLTGESIDPLAFWSKVRTQSLKTIQQSPLLPGVETLIQGAKNHALKLAVASSSTHEWVDGHLRRYNLIEYFDVIKCREDVKNYKPAPDLFLAAAQAVGVEPQEALIFEDSLNGIIAARSAGIRVVVVPNPITRHLKLEGETLRLQSLADISLEELLAMF